MRSLTLWLAACLTLLAPAAASADVIVLDETAAEAIANALNEAQRLAAELELTRAKLAVADERIANLTERDLARQAQIDSLTERVGELKAAVERNAAADARVIATLEDTARALEASRKALETAGHRSAWSYVWDGIKILGAILPFLLLSMAR